MEVVVAVVLVLLTMTTTRASLRSGSVREPVNLALLDGVIVGIARLARYLAVRIQEIQSRQREPGPEGRSCLCRLRALGLARRG
jgi:hypothetical protein